MSRRFIYTRSHESQFGDLRVLYLVVGGGGGGSSGGGNGANGGLALSGSTTITKGTSLTIQIGLKGTGHAPGSQATGNNGQDTIVSGRWTATGGYGGGTGSQPQNGSTIGWGASIFNAHTAYKGLGSSISGTLYYYGAGGGNSTYQTGGVTGGGDGGAQSAFSGTDGSSATFYGSGGGGGGLATNIPTYYRGGNGANGVVIVRYTASTQLMSGGTVTTSGGDYIHTFTTDGTLTY